MPQAPTVELPKRLPLILEPSNRADSTSFDAKLVNGFVEHKQGPGENEYWIYERPGMDEQSRPPSGNAAGAGVYKWEGAIYSVFGETFYKNGVAVAGTVDATGGVYRFNSTLGSTPKLQLGNGVAAYNYDDTNGLVHIATAATLTAGDFVVGVEYTILTVGNTDFVAVGAASNSVGVVFTATGAGSGTGTAAGAVVVTAGAFVIGTGYTILAPGTTDFTLIGAADSIAGTVFTATGVGTGDGTAIGPSFPATFVKGWAFLNGTTYVMTPSAHILGSEINEPGLWPPLNDILAQIEPDGGVALAKQLVYVVAFKEWSTEIFYDAGNTVGSPLGRVEGAKIGWGCLSADSVRSLDSALLWLGKTKEGSPEVLILDNLKASAVSTKSVERLLRSVSLATVFSWTISVDGHRFYVLTFKESNLTLAFDLDSRLWSQWTDTNGNYVPIVSSTVNSSLQHLLQHETNGRIYIGSMDYATDDGELITVDLVTPNFDAGTRRRKNMKVLELVTDQVTGSSMQVRVNDFDYQADRWTNWRSFDLGQRKPTLPDCGTFVRRVHHFRHRSPVRMPRIYGVEMQIDIGTL